MSARKHERGERGQGSATQEDEPNKKPKEKKALVAVRLDQEDIKRIDDLRPYFSTLWRQANRSDVLRALIMEVLPEVEKRARRSDGGKGKEPASKR